MTTKMNRFIVISPHTAEDCKMAVNQFREHNAGFLTHFEWGCMDNDHTAYTILDADNHETARLSVPPLFRDKTRVVRVMHFDPKAKKDLLHK